MLPIYLLAIVSVLNLCIALLVLQRSVRYRKTSLLFVASAFTVAIWALGDGMLLNQVGEVATWWARTLFLVAPLLTMYFLLLFALRFPEDGVITRRVLVAATLPVVVSIIILVCFNDRFIASIVREEMLNTVSVSPLLYGLYALVFTIYFVVICAVFYVKLRLFKGIQRTQIWYVFLGAFFSSVLAFSTNLTLPLLGVGELIWMGPLFTIVYMMSYTIAIARYRLFDLRRAAGRAVAYLLSLALIGLLYALAVSVLRDWVESVLFINLNSSVYYLGFTLLSLIIFPGVKRWFDVLTHSIFFRHDYDVQETINLYGDRLISVNGREGIVRVVRNLTKKIFGVQKVHFIFHSKSDSQLKGDFLALLNASHFRSITLDEVLTVNKTLYENMHDKGYEFILHLKTAHSDIGWLLLGEKGNGEPYDRQDVRTMNTVADEIAISLENALNYEEIEDFNKTLQKKVNDATIELRATNKKLHDLDESKDEFISMASHQLRTPLTTVKGYISMVLDGDVGEIAPKQRKVLEEAFGSAQRMVYLISDFLNVSRLQTGKFELELGPTDLAALVMQEAQQLQDTATSRQMKLEYEPPTDFPLMALDENKIRQVVMNFIDNALYYTKAGDTIHITLMRQNNEAVFKVTDHGIGVPANERHKLFSKFYRASNAKKQRPDGTGIGLFMSRKVIAAHGGTIIFESTEGKGSTFGFRLPLQDGRK